MSSRELATLLKHIYRHQGEPIDINAVEKLLPPEVDYTRVERSLIKEHLIILITQLGF